MSHPAVQLVPVDDEVAVIYGEIVSEIVADLRSAGQPLPANDISIAATAARFGAMVLTFDARCQQIHRVSSLVLDPT